MTYATIALRFTRSRSVTLAATSTYRTHRCFPGKRTRAGKPAAVVEDFDSAKPLVVDNLHHNNFQPACNALGLGPVRFHDLRYTFAAGRRGRPDCQESKGD
jgi:hypothetical protein